MRLGWALSARASIRMGLCQPNGYVYIYTCVKGTSHSLWIWTADRRLDVPWRKRRMEDVVGLQHVLQKNLSVTWSGLRVDWRYLVSCAALVAMMVAVLTSLVFQRSEHEYSGEGLPVSWGFLV